MSAQSIINLTDIQRSITDQQRALDRYKDMDVNQKLPLEFLHQLRRLVEPINPYNVTLQCGNGWNCPGSKAQIDHANSIIEAYIRARDNELAGTNIPNGTVPRRQDAISVGGEPLAKATIKRLEQIIPPILTPIKPAEKRNCPGAPKRPIGRPTKAARTMSLAISTSPESEIPATQPNSPEWSELSD